MMRCIAAIERLVSKPWKQAVVCRTDDWLASEYPDRSVFLARYIRPQRLPCGGADFPKTGSFSSFGRRWRLIFRKTFLLLIDAASELDGRRHLFPVAPSFWIFCSSDSFAPHPTSGTTAAAVLAELVFRSRRWYVTKQNNIL